MFFVLYGASRVNRDSFASSAIPFNDELVEVAVFQGCFRKIDFPNSVVLACQFVFVTFFPVGECANHRNSGCIGCPFAEYPSGFRFVEAEILVSVGKVDKTAFFPTNSISFRIASS